MRKIIAAFILCFVFLGVPRAAAQFYFGPTAGLNISTLTKQTYSKARYRGNVGLFLGYQASNILALQAEVLYSWQGTNYTNDDTKKSFNYIKVPILAKVTIVGGLNVEAGLGFNFLMNSRSILSDEVNLNISGISHKFDFTIPVGVNYLFFKKLELGLRYDISTVRVFQDSENRSCNSNISVNLRYRF